MKIEVTTDISAFRRKASPFLRLEPLQNTALLTILGPTADQVLPDADSLFVLAYGPLLAGVAIRCRYRGWVISLLPDELISAVAEAIAREDASVRRFLVQSSIAGILAADLTRLTGRPFRWLGGHQLHKLGTLLPAGADGSGRPANASDTTLCIRWLSAFDQEMGVERRPHRQTVAAQVQTGRLWLWERAGKVVSLLHHHREIAGVVRIGPVYTPPPERGNGYAAALVSYVSQRIISQGLIACLHTDMHNPAPARIYAGLGYHPVSEYSVYEADFGSNALSARSP
jgi:GNAT superfamily N-acetyltransferase